MSAPIDNSQIPKLDKPQGRWVTRNDLEWEIWTRKGDTEFWYPLWPSNVKWTSKGGNGLVRVESSEKWKWDKRFDLMGQIK